MATLFMDNAEIYGVPAATLDGMYAEATGFSLEIIDNLPSFAFRNNAGRLRRPLTALTSTIFTAGRMRMSVLPVANYQSAVLRLCDVDNVCTASMWVDTTGRIVISRGEPTAGGTELVRSIGPVIKANTWQHIEIKWVIGNSGTVEVRVDDSSIPVITYSGDTMFSAAPAQLTWGGQGGGMDTFWTDLHVWDTTGTRNINFLGDVAVATLWPNADVETGWTPNYRRKIGTGILSMVTADPNCLTMADSASLELGSGDFTIETFLRWDTLPTNANRSVIFGKWVTVDDFAGPVEQRSYELSKCGPGLNTGNIEFRISTSGTAGTVQTIISQPWAPELDRWYHVAVSRASGQTMLFIDGIMQGVPQADANVYFSGTAPAVLGATVNTFFGSLNTVANTKTRAWYDETRLSLMARYLANFTPTTIAFGRSIAGDPNFATVSLLMGYDNGIGDESSFARQVNGTGNQFSSIFPVAILPDDGFFQYQTINQEDTLAHGPPRDDTSISAALYRATGVLTAGGIPANGNTVTIGDVSPITYTFKTTLAVADDVLIGASPAASLFNLYSAINGAAGSGTLYGAGTTPHTEVFATQLPGPQIQISANIAGTDGNDIGTTRVGANLAFSDPTLTGGADIPGPSSFRLSRMPVGVTVVRSVMSVTRAYKTEAGPAKMKTNLVGPNGTITEGLERTLPVEPAYTTEVFEADPDTAGVLTPATLLTGRIQFNRTQ